MKYVIFASYGNDSVALIQFAHERGLSNVFWEDSAGFSDYRPLFFLRIRQATGLGMLLLAG